MSPLRLAIADPPYPPIIRASGKPCPRASRWYGDNAQSATDQPADVHGAAGDWDDPERHRRLLADLLAEYDGWAIATSADGLRAYGELPQAARVMVWVRDTEPGAHRLASRWEAVILYPPEGRRSNRGVGQVSNVLIVPAPRVGFRGAKPLEWATWVLDALGYDPDTDTVDDLFPGSGMVSACARQRTLFDRDRGTDTPHREARAE